MAQTPKKFDFEPWFKLLFSEGLSHGSNPSIIGLWAMAKHINYWTLSHGSNPQKTELWAMAQTHQLLTFEPWLKPPQNWIFEPWLKPTFDMQIFTWFFWNTMEVFNLYYLFIFMVLLKIWMELPFDEVSGLWEEEAQRHLLRDLERDDTCRAEATNCLEKTIIFLTLTISKQLQRISLCILNLKSLNKIYRVTYFYKMISTYVKGKGIVSILKISNSIFTAILREKIRFKIVKTRVYLEELIFYITLN